MSASLEKIWQQLSQADLVSGTKPEFDEEDSPWFVKAIQAFSGWLAALFILGFIGIVFSSYLTSPVPCLFFGGFAILTGLGLIFTASNSFIENLGLAVSLAGQALVLFGLIQIKGLSETLVCVSMFILQAALCYLMRSYTHRALSALFAMLALYLALWFESLSVLFYGPVLFLCTLIWMHEFKFPSQMHRLRPIGYGCVLALVVLTGTRVLSPKNISDLGFNFHFKDTLTLQLVTQALIAAAMLYLVVSLLKRYKLKIFSGTGIIAMVAVVAVCTLSFFAPGVAVGISIILIGFANVNNLLMALGVITLIVYTSSYYYQLDTTLLVKALSMLALGVALLVGRWLLPTLLPSGEKHA